MTPEQLRYKLDVAGFARPLKKPVPRASSDITYCDFAAMTGLTVRALNQWLAGDRAIPCWVDSWLGLWRELSPQKQARLRRQSL